LEERKPKISTKYFGYPVRRK